MAGGQRYIRSGDRTKSERLGMVDKYANDLWMAGRMTPAVEAAISKARWIRIGHSAVFYIAGPLTGMDEPTKQRYADVSDLAARHDGTFAYAPHLHGTDPVKHPDVSPGEVRDIDYLYAALVPNAHINFLDPVAHGNAIEEGWAEMMGIPSLYVVHEDTRLSRLVKGMHNVLGTIVYKDFEQDALPQIDKFLQSI